MTRTPDAVMKEICEKSGNKWQRGAEFSTALEPDWHMSGQDFTVIFLFR